MRRRLAKNSLSGLLQLVCSSILSFTAIPLFIHVLGSEAYGLYAAVSVIGNLNIFADLGLSTSLIKYLSEQGKTKQSDHDIVVTLILAAMFAIFLSIIAYAFCNIIIKSVLHIPQELIADAKWLYFCLIIANAFLLCGQPFSAILDADQRNYLTNSIQLLYNVLYWGGIIVALLLGMGLKAIGVTILFAAVGWFVVLAATSLKKWGGVTLMGLYSNFFKTARKQLSYGSKIYASGLIGFFYEPVTKILISSFLGVREVGYFDIAIRVKGQLWSALNKSLYPLFPYIPKVSEFAKVRFLIHDLGQKIFYIIIPIIVNLVLLGQTFITVWLGEQNAYMISSGVIWITSAFLVGATVIPSYQFLIAKGHAGKTIILQTSNVLANGLVFLVTQHWLGFYAVVLAHSCAIMTSFTISLYYQKKYLNSLIFDNFGQVIKVAFIAAVTLIVGFEILQVLASDWSKLLLIPPIIVLVTLLMYKLLGLVKRADFERYLGELGKLKYLGAK